MKNNKRNKSKKGFTLIEMVIVMAIMAILIGLVAPGAMKQIKNAKAKSDMASARDVATAITQGIVEEKIKSPAAESTEIIAANGKYMIEDAEIVLPTLKVRAGGKYYYYYEDEQVHILVGKSDGSDQVELYPSYDSDYIK